MVKIINFVKHNPISILLLFFPLAIFAEMGHWGATWVFVFSAIGVIPMASYIGESTEALAHYTGPRLGGLLNATLGNAAELIITIFALQRGLLELVKASITGSILGNLLLVLGASMLFGGLKNGVQRYDRRHATHNAVLLLMAVLLLLVPSLFSHSIGEVNPPSIEVEALSLGTAAIMMIIYSLGLIFSFNTPKAFRDSQSAPEEKIITSEAENDEGHSQKGWSLRTAVCVLALSTLGVVVVSELLVGSVEPMMEKIGISEFFVGIIFIPIIGNVAEHLVAVQVAIKNKMSLSVEIAVASSLQIALFVAPVLVFVSLLFGDHMTLVFNQFELFGLIAAVLVVAYVSEDGESNWLEGVLLLALYLVFALAFYLLPGLQ